MRSRIARELRELREGTRQLPGVLRLILHLGGPVGVLIYKWDGTLERRIAEWHARRQQSTSDED